MTDEHPETESAAEPSDRAKRTPEPDRSGTGQHALFDDTTAESDESGSRDDDPSPPQSDASNTDGRDETTARRIRLLYWTALGVCALLAVVALSRFYASIEAAIDVWIAAEYQPIASGAFNLAVLLVALVGVSAAIRRLSQ